MRSAGCPRNVKICPVLCTVYLLLPYVCTLFDIKLALCHHPVPLCTDSDSLFLPSADDLFRHIRSVSSSRSRRDANQPHCELKALSLTFSDIGLDKVIHPLSIGINDCRGGCNDLTLLTQHGKFRAALWRLETVTASDRGHFPSCVPIAYKPVVLLLYYASTGRTEIKRYENMVATECSCV